MTELWQSINAWFKEKTSSPLYATYIFCLIAWNWKLFFVLFFQDQSALSVPKIEYVEAKFFGSYNLLWHTLFYFGPPIIATYFIIRWLPYFTTWAHRYHTDFFFRRKGAFDDIKLEYENKKKESLSELATLKREQKQSSIVIAENTSEPEKWELEFEDFRKRDMFSKFKQIVNVVYENNGRVTDSYSGSRNAEAATIAYAHARGLIHFVNPSNEQIELTDKGRYFTQRFLDV